MGDKRRMNCIQCGRHRSEAGDISWHGLCETCGHANLAENIRGLASLEPVVTGRWLRGMERYIERARVDKPQVAA